MIVVKKLALADCAPLTLQNVTDRYLHDVVLRSKRTNVASVSGEVAVMFDTSSTPGELTRLSESIALADPALTHLPELEMLLRNLPVQCRLRRKQVLFRAGQPRHSIFIDFCFTGF